MKKNLIFINSIVLTIIFFLSILFLPLVTPIEDIRKAVLFWVIGVSLISALFMILASEQGLSSGYVYVSNFIVLNILTYCLSLFYFGEEMLMLIFVLPTIFICVLVGAVDMTIQHLGKPSLFAKKETVKESVAGPAVD